MWAQDTSDGRPMFEVLLESRHVGLRLPAGGAAISAVAHAAAAALIVAGSQTAATELPDTPSLAHFMLPPDRKSTPAQEHIRYVGVGAGEAMDGAGDGSLQYHVRGAFGLARRVATPKSERKESAERPASDPQSAAEEALPENTYTLADVDTAVFRYPESAAPSYPESLRRRGIAGEAAVQFIVDSTGMIDLSTVRILAASHPDFAKAVRDAMPRMRFHPAKIGPKAVGQLAQQLFKFEMRSPDSSMANPRPAPIP